MPQIEVKIALIVGDNGNWSANKFDGQDTDWGFLSDAVGVYDKAKKEVVYQNVEKRYVVTALVDLPVIDKIAAANVIEIEPIS